MHKAERVSVDNVVVRFFSEKSEAESVAKILNAKTFQVGEENRYLISSDITIEQPEIFDCHGMIFSAKSQSRSLEARLWIQEVVKDMKEV